MRLDLHSPSRTRFRLRYDAIHPTLMHEIDRGGRGDLSVDLFNGAIVRSSTLAALSPFGPHARSAISAILRNVNTRRRFASGSFAISASVSAIVLPYAWYVGISASG